MAGYAIMWPMTWLDGQGLGRNMVGKLVTKKSEEDVCGQTFLNGQKKNVKIFVSHVNVPQKVTSAEEDFGNQEDKMTCFVNTSQPLSPASLSLPHGL